jgi:hypothetical protein
VVSDVPACYTIGDVEMSEKRLDLFLQHGNHRHAKLNQDELVSSVGIAGTSEVGRIIAKAFRL